MRSSSGTLAVVELAAAGATDPGRQREQNEDRFHIDLASGLFLVVDGVGGEAAGEVAAQIAVQTIVTRLARQDGPADVRVREAITLANQDIYRQASQQPGRTGMACVLTVALLEGRHLTIGHVGDSRLYKLTAHGIAKLTHDHSPIGEREDAREISETQAMQHARRNEVYRDVGSEPRQPDDPSFIEIVLADVEDDAAILLCSDGLSDMLTSAEINRLARAHAGDQQAVADALVAAANAAGGKDNITVVYAEGPSFARGGAIVPQATLPRPIEPVSTTPLADLAEPPAPPRPGRLRRVLRSRALALVLGTLIGLGATLALLFYVPTPFREEVAGPRLIAVGSSAPGAHATIAAALAAARRGDTVRVEPGEYAESLLLPEGVTLSARTRGTAVLTAPAGRPDWVAITAAAGPGVIQGFRIEGRAGAPVSTGIRVLGSDIEVDDVTFEGTIAAGVIVGGRAAGVVLRASRFNITGVPLRVSDGAAPTVRQNVFVAGAGGRLPALEVSADAGPTMDGNVFVHFMPVVSPASRRDKLLEGNFVIAPGARR